jgi:hypothetical protein
VARYLSAHSSAIMLKGQWHKIPAYLSAHSSAWKSQGRLSTSLPYAQSSFNLQKYITIIYFINIILVYYYTLKRTCSYRGASYTTEEGRYRYFLSTYLYLNGWTIFYVVHRSNCKCTYWPVPNFGIDGALCLTLVWSNLAIDGAIRIYTDLCITLVYMALCV